MSTEQIITTKQFDPSLVTLGKPKGNYITVFYPLNSQDVEFTKLKIQTPKMKIPFDTQERKSRMGEVFAINVTVSTDEIGTDKNKARIEMFREKILELENKIKRKLPQEFQRKTFSSSLWQGKNADFKPTMRLSIRCFDQIPSVKVFDSDGDKVDVSHLVQRSVGIFVISLDSIWSTTDKVGVNWNIEEVKLSKNDQPTKKKTNILTRDEFDD